jgi:Lon protease-like protein
MSNAQKLPLFPLGTVLFPGDAIPLQIFEPRYAQMLGDCQEADGRFGVLLIKAGPEVGGNALTHNIGTVARIIQVSDVGGGRFFVSAGGERRFRLISRDTDDPYPIGDVELLTDEPGTGDLDALAAGVAAATRDLMNLTLGLGGGWAGDQKVPDDPAVLSYYVPKLLKIDTTESQVLLESETISERLGIEASLLAAQTEALKARVSQGLKSRFSSN